MYLEDRKTFQCHPSARIIGKAVGLSENTMHKYIRRLEDKGLIYTEHTKVRPRNGPPRNGNLLFTVRPIQDAVENYQERQLAEADAERQHQEAMRRVEDYNDQHPDKPITVTENDRPPVPAP